MRLGKMPLNEIGSDQMESQDYGLKELLLLIWTSSLDGLDVSKETLESILDENLSVEERKDLINIEEMKRLLKKYPEYYREMLK
jgi:hypothetical protein